MSNKIGQFVPHRPAMLRSPALRVLSLTGRRILDRLEIEHLNHGGKENGKLTVTFANLKKFGMANPNDIARGFRELRALGFIEVTRAGRAGIGEHRISNQFRITYLSSDGKAPTDEWRSIATIEEAERVAREARNISQYRKTIPDQYRKTISVTGIGKRTKASISPVSENDLLSREDLASLGGRGPGPGKSRVQ